MKYSGNWTEIDEDFSISECDDELTEVIVSKDRIAFDWIEDGSNYGTTLYPKSKDCDEYFGDITIREEPHERGYISAYRYDLKGGDILLIAKWWLYENQGVCTFELNRAIK